MGLNTKSIKSVTLAVIVVAGIAIALSWWQARHKQDAGTSPAPLQTDAKPAKRPVTNIVATTPSSSVVSGSSALDKALQRLKALGPADDPREVLADLRRALSLMPPAEAAKFIREFLDSKQDANTRLSFKISPDGFLAESPSLRVFLLDYLAQSDPTAATAYAKVILSDMNSADEWAVAMRNYARGSPDADSRGYLEGKLKEMFNHDAWRQQPSVGYLEAFDVAVYLRGTGLVAPLAELVRDKDNRAVAHAAFLTLDRLTIAEPVGTLGKLQAEPELMKGREQTRANYFARADVSDPQQRALVEKYLMDSRLTGNELATFAGVYPNANFMVSPNLLTVVHTPNGSTLATKDRAALQVVNEWMNDPRFEKQRPLLQNIRTRLEGFVKAQ